MTSSHILFIPCVLMIGMFLGFVLGGRAVRNQIALQDKRDADREVARAKRDADRAARKVVASEPAPAPTEIEPPSKVVSVAPTSAKSGSKKSKAKSAS
ncbi:MAG: hypothetical protein WKG01_11970 [Kofleriaceae bacterium]